MISIIVPIYNREAFIERALNSIPKRDDINLIIVDDCSEDNSLSIIKNWTSENDFKYTLIENKVNVGAGASKRKAYKLSNDEFIYVLDSDDYILTDKFNDLLNHLDDYKDYDIIRVKAELNNGQVDSRPHTSGWSYILRNRFDVDYPEMRKAEDWYYWLELQRQGAKIINTDLVVYHYNYPHEGSLVWQFENGIIDWKGDVKC